MQKNCAQCGIAFALTQSDEELMRKIAASSLELREIPPPSRCPDCRQQRRLARRNECKYYKRNCDLCTSEIISMYAKDAPFPVYCYSCWWSDQWDPLSYGKGFDPSRSFIEQFALLQNSVPRIALFGKNNVNCEYTNHTVGNKNCYLCVDVADCEDVFYSKWMIKCRDCIDCYQLEKSELCYESQYSVHLSRSIYAFLCDKSYNLAFCYDCEDCHDCFLCHHLRHKSFCIGNEQLSEAEYKKRMQEWDFRSNANFQRALGQYLKMWQGTFHRDQHILFSEECSGDFIYHCKNVRDSFGVIESQDCTYCYDAGHMKDCMDAYEPAFDCELQYDSQGCNNGKRLLACHICWHNDALAYCDFCHNSSHLFGCIGLRRKQFCILNRQYTKEEYEKLVPRLIEHMKATPYQSPSGSGAGQDGNGAAMNPNGVSGSWGEYFPISLSPFSYNETVAQEYFPLSMHEVVDKGWKWKEEMDEIPAVEKIIPAESLPDSTNDIPDDVLNWALRSEVTQRPFLIDRQELSFYRKMHLPIPRLHADERHKRRMAFTNPRKLFARICAKCGPPGRPGRTGKRMQTTYSPERPEIVFCEQCYLQAVY